MLPAFIILIVIVAIVLAVVWFKKRVLGSSRTQKRPKTARKPIFRTINDIRGEYGEYKVESVLGENVDGEKYVINGYIYEKNGRSTEIDHIVVNPRGVFVIETKNRAGDIFGDDLQEEWKQVLGKGDIVNTFRNPVKQNDAHVAKIKTILGDGIPVFSLVVFVKDNTQNINSTVVVPLSELKLALNSGKSVLNSRQICLIYESLLRQQSTMSHEQHIQNVKEQNYKIFVLRVCPSCNSKLVESQDCNGKYLSCSNPKCKFKTTIK